MATIIATICIL